MKGKKMGASVNARAFADNCGPQVHTVGICGCTLKCSIHFECVQAKGPDHLSRIFRSPHGAARALQRITKPLRRNRWEKTEGCQRSGRVYYVEVIILPRISPNNQPHKSNDHARREPYVETNFPETWQNITKFWKAKIIPNSKILPKLN